MSMLRTVEPELLDVMSPEDPRAIRARRDLRRVNALMGHTRVWRRTLAATLTPTSLPRRIVEVGTGDASLLLRLAPDLAARWPNVALELVDRHPAVDTQALEAFAALGWRVKVITADVRDWVSSMPAADLTMTNLFLHHFGDVELADFFRHVARKTSVFVACEPRRSALALVSSHLLGLVGCGPVSRYDAVVSVHAGFSGRELTALWPEEAGWALHEAGTGLFSHLFMTRRASGPGAAVRP